MFARLSQKLDSFLALGAPWNDCVVYHKGRPIYRRTAGTLDLEGNRPATGRELFNLYSCSKIITCTAALLLYQKGLFRLTDPLSDYLPEYAEMRVRNEDGTTRPAKNVIRLLDLFRMSAGFTYDLRSPSLNKLRQETKTAPTRAFARYHAKEPLISDPGALFCYSLAHDVLAAVVEVIADTEFNAFCKKNIFDPVEMPNTTFLLPYAEYDAVAPLYSYNIEEKRAVECGKIPVYRLGEAHASGGAGCVSTVDEYIRFLEALRTGKLLTEATLDLMATDTLTDAQRATYSFASASGYGYGLGVRCPKKGDKTITDFGWGGAAGAYALIDREHELTAFYIQHVLASPVQAVRGELRPVIMECLFPDERQAAADTLIF